MGLLSRIAASRETTGLTEAKSGEVNYPEADSSEVTFPEAGSGEANYTETGPGESATPTEETALKDPDPIESAIVQFCNSNNDLNCIVLEKPDSGENDKPDFCGRVSEIIRSAGTVISLPGDRPAILFSKKMDRELIAHRLSRNFNTVTLLSFEANSPEKVINQINSLP